MGEIEPLERDARYLASKRPVVSEDRYVKSGEAMTFLGIKPTTFYKYKKLGLIKAYRVSRGLIRYRLSELEAFFRRRPAS